MIFFFNDTATTEIYTLSLHDALPIYDPGQRGDPALPDAHQRRRLAVLGRGAHRHAPARVLEGHEEQDDQDAGDDRSEEHTSELQSRQYLVCRLLLEKKKNKQETHASI